MNCGDASLFFSPLTLWVDMGAPSLLFCRSGESLRGTIHDKGWRREGGAQVWLGERVEPSMTSPEWKAAANRPRPWDPSPDGAPHCPKRSPPMAMSARTCAGVCAFKSVWELKMRLWSLAGTLEIPPVYLAGALLSSFPVPLHQRTCTMEG